MCSEAQSTDTCTYRRANRRGIVDILDVLDEASIVVQDAATSLCGGTLVALENGCDCELICEVLRTFEHGIRG